MRFSESRRSTAEMESGSERSERTRAGEVIRGRPSEKERSDGEKSRSGSKGKESRGTTTSSWLSSGR